MRSLAGSFREETSLKTFLIPSSVVEASVSSKEELKISSEALHQVSLSEDLIHHVPHEDSDLLANPSCVTIPYFLP